MKGSNAAIWYVERVEIMCAGSGFHPEAGACERMRR
eukprot:CAMPEP_0195651860 /NCGR_PEP_ID=MMETSP0815-20121206/32505_1 /TAXON_ID=97485 /ORGANISM="Prymnesium parvum, Strain Texoma1" /LENGTH=35 /DNA_ID= /DNA_START= /DNA_END= /DNA_ORIENTATION=